MTEVQRIGYQITDDELKRIQDIQVELIEELDRVCKKNGIHYNMVGGTMLGVIRHGGHIPWDDDADIGFLREEYEKFRKACKKDLDHNKYYIQDFRDTEGYRWGYGKLRRKGTEFIRNEQEFMPYEQGIFIDLMPFDNVPNDPILRRIHFAQCFVFRKIFWSKVGAKTEPKPAIRMVYLILSLIPEGFVKRQFEHFINRGRLRKTDLVRILTFPTPKGIYGYNREWYTNTRRYRFNRLELPGAKDFDGYLKVKYGDYMQLPPVEKRKVHPISKLKLI